MKTFIFAIIFLCSACTQDLSVSNYKQGLSVQQKTRYFVKSNKKELKHKFKVQHEFKNGFSVNLSFNQAQELQNQGVVVELVPIYQPIGRPVCGDGKCQAREDANNCPDDCSDEPTPDPDLRSCYPDVQVPWGVEMVKGGSGGSGVNVFVLDTGVNNHLDLNVSICKDTTKRGIKDGCKDEDGHGTHVMGTVAANGGVDGLGIYGVAPSANINMIKVCGARGCYTDDIAEAIIYSVNENANIISMSIGGNNESILIRDAVAYAVNNGVLVVAAAGNDGPDLGSIDYPGANPNIIAVAAVDSLMEVTEWSSRGINDGDYVIETQEVELAAPGLHVLSTYNNGCYAIMSGTSMATPHVAGLAAKFWQGDAEATRTYLQQIAIDIDALGDDPASGFGVPIDLEE